MEMDGYFSSVQFAFYTVEEIGYTCQRAENLLPQ